MIEKSDNIKNEYYNFHRIQKGWSGGSERLENIKVAS